MRSKLTEYPAWIIFAGIILFLAFNMHSRITYLDYHSEIWSDKAGYYVYLPAFFLYDFDPHKFPENIDLKTGNGFRLDLKNNKVRTKYPCGTAVLQAPFFLLANALAPVFSFNRDGFAPVYHWALYISAVTYLLIALIFLRKVLLKYLPLKVTYITLFALFSGTNLFYFTIDSCAASHIYSFFLFSVFLYLTVGVIRQKKIIPLQMIMISIIAALIILVRPVNVIFLFIIFFIGIKNSEDLIKRMKKLFTLKNVCIFLVISFLIFLPQFLYWNYAEGKFLVYSYKGESFTNWHSPKIIEVLFAPRNGWLLYNPLHLFALAGILILMKREWKRFVIIPVILIIATYIFASWWDYGFGCSIGHRCYVEYYAMLSIPFGYSVYHIYKIRSAGIKIFIFSIMIIFIICNLKVIYTYDDCFFGSSTWDWDEYLRLITSSSK